MYAEATHLATASVQYLGFLWLSCFSIFCICTIWWLLRWKTFKLFHQSLLGTKSAYRTPLLDAAVPGFHVTTSLWSWFSLPVEIISLIHSRTQIRKVWKQRTHAGPSYYTHLASYCPFRSNSAVNLVWGGCTRALGFLAHRTLISEIGDIPSEPIEPRKIWR